MTEAEARAQLATLKEHYELLCDRMLVLQQQHEETIGYRQHAEQEVERLRKLITHLAPFTREGLEQAKQVAYENEDDLTVRACTQWLEDMKEFQNDMHESRDRNAQGHLKP